MEFYEINYSMTVKWFNFSIEWFLGRNTRKENISNIFFKLEYLWLNELNNLPPEMDIACKVSIRNITSIIYESLLM